MVDADSRVKQLEVNGTEPTRGMGRRTDTREASSGLRNHLQRCLGHDEGIASATISPNLPWKTDKACEPVVDSIHFRLVCAVHSTRRFGLYSNGYSQPPAEGDLSPESVSTNLSLYPARTVLLSYLVLGCLHTDSTAMLDSLVWSLTSGVNVVLNFAVVVVPIPATWALQLHRKQRIILTLLFGLGFW